MKINLFPIRYGLILLDALCWLIAMLIVLAWRLIAVKSVVWEYALEYLFLAIGTLVVGALLGKYRPLKRTRFVYILLSNFATWLVVIIAITCIREWFVIELSQRVVYAGMSIVAALNMIYLLGFYFWKYAQHMEEDSVIPVYNREYVEVIQEAVIRPEVEIESIYSSIKEYANEDVLNYLNSAVTLNSTNTKLVANADTFSIANLPNSKYDTIVNLKLLNDVRGINLQFCKASEKLPDDGIFVCCFRPQRVMQERIMKKYPPVINYIIYVIFFLWRRVMPKLLTTSRLYFDITHGTNRVLSITEVLGRLYYCGFEVIEETFVGHIVYVKARRVQNPQPQSRLRRYGPLIKLSRIGKNGKKFNVYKMRTMHPYSEFLQQYIFEKNDLQEGGKIKNDVRVSTLGAIMRKYWIDELPMFINFFKGDMKFVGVRPLSSHYFSLYSKELQEKRTKSKPGLFPPFYADMPKTLDDIQASEMRYLNMCEDRGTFITDIIYLWRIFVNIVFKKARSK